MNERSSKRKKKEHDFAVKAYEVFQKAIGEELETKEAPEPTIEERHEAAVTLGRAGGKKGGPARAAKLTPDQRQEIAKRAAAARWHRD